MCVWYRLTGRQHERDKPFNIWLSTDRKTHTHTHTHTGGAVPVLIIRTLLLNLTLPLERDRQRWRREAGERGREDEEKDERFCLLGEGFLTLYLELKKNERCHRISPKEVLHWL